VLEAVLTALHARGIEYGAIRIAGTDHAFTVGRELEATRRGIVFEGHAVGELEVAVDDRAFTERVATLVSPYVAALSSRHG
jgi:hypothetical protein